MTARCPNTRSTICTLNHRLATALVASNSKGTDQAKHYRVIAKASKIYKNTTP
jgi:uncharacterized protein (DUF736 family)